MTYQKCVAVVAGLMFCSLVQGEGFVGVGTFSPELSVESEAPDTEFEADSVSIRQIKFSYKDKAEAQLLSNLVGGINIDDHNEIKHLEVGFNLSEYIIHIESGTLSGRFVSDSDKIKSADFDNDYKRIDIRTKHQAHGFRLGYAYHQFQLPHVFTYGEPYEANVGGQVRSELGNRYIFDDALEIKTIGWSGHYDPVYQLMVESALKFDTGPYIAFDNGFGIGVMTAGDNAQMRAKGFDNKTWYVMSVTGNYELGWFVKGKKADLVFAAKAAYRISHVLLMNLNLSEANEVDTRENEILMDFKGLELSGPAFELDIKF